MKNRSLCFMFLLALLAFGLLIAGCSGGNDTAAEADKAAPATESAPAETVATHDCEGDCGMKAVPEDQMTKVDGKWLCGGCAKKAQAEAATEDQGEG